MDQVCIHILKGTLVVTGNSMIVNWPMENAQLSSMCTIARIANIPKDMKELDKYALPQESWSKMLHVNYPSNYHVDSSQNLDRKVHIPLENLS